MRHLILLLLFALPVKAEVVAMTTDFASVQAAIQASELSGELAARSGGLHYHRNGNSAIIVVDSLNGLEGLAALADEVTNYKEIFGYRVQKVVDGEPQWTTETVNVPERTIYHDNWVDTGATDEMGMPDYENQPIPEVIPASSYEQQVPVYDEVPRVPGMLELYQSIYPYNVPDEDGNTRSQFVVTFGPDSVKDILIN